jgi:hypothetical protein
MAGFKLSAKAQEEVEFLESLIKHTDHLLGVTEQYAGAKGPSADALFQTIVRTMNQIRQKAMIKNLGPIADAAGMIAVGAARGSPVQRTRFLREQLASYKTNVERTMKALVGADLRERAEQEKVMAQRKKSSQEG